MRRITLRGLPMHLRVSVLAGLFLLFTAPGLLAQEPSLTGRWSGRWESKTSGHTGPLNARFTQTDPSHYRVVFSGRFFKVIPFRYAQTLEITGHEGDTVFLAGSSRLIGFGTFEYSASATSHSFQSTYRSRNDTGTFILGR